MAFVYWCLAAVKKVVLLDERRLPSLPCLQWTLTCPSLLDCTMVLPLTSGCQCPASLKFTSRILPSHPLCQRGSASVQTHLCLSLLLSPLLFFWPSCCCGPLDCSLCTDLSNAWLFQSHRLGFFFSHVLAVKSLVFKSFLWAVLPPELVKCFSTSPPYTASSSHSFQMSAALLTAVVNFFQWLEFHVWYICSWILSFLHNGFKAIWYQQAKLYSQAGALYSSSIAPAWPFQPQHLFSHILYKYIYTVTSCTYPNQGRLNMSKYAPSSSAFCLVLSAAVYKPNK